MLSNYSNIFSIVGEIAKKQEEYLPLPSHEDLQKKWRVQMNHSIEQITEEKICVEKVQYALFSLVELFNKYASFNRSYSEIEEVLNDIFHSNPNFSVSNMIFRLTDVKHTSKDIGLSSIRL